MHWFIFFLSLLLLQYSHVWKCIGDCRHHTRSVPVFDLHDLFISFHRIVSDQPSISRPHPSLAEYFTCLAWLCRVHLEDERMIRHSMWQVGKQTVQRKRGDEGRDQACGHSPYVGPVLRPGLCLYRPQAQLMKPASDPMWWPLWGQSMTQPLSRLR